VRKFEIIWFLTSWLMVDVPCFLQVSGYYYAAAVRGIDRDEGNDK
jgi:hypothetical protein